MQRLRYLMCAYHEAVGKVPEADHVLVTHVYTCPTGITQGYSTLLIARGKRDALHLDSRSQIRFILLLISAAPPARHRGPSVVQSYTRTFAAVARTFSACSRKQQVVHLALLESQVLSPRLLGGTHCVQQDPSCVRVRLLPPEQRWGVVRFAPVL